MHDDFAHIDTWIFDLDNTLYPAATDLFALVDARMGQFIETLTGCDADQARRLQKDYFRDHGTTVAGLMATYGTDPHTFLEFVHDIALDRLQVDEALVAHMARLPGRKLVFTNGDAPYAQRVLDRLGLGSSFEAIHDIHAMAYMPKPNPASYVAMCERLAIDPAHAVFVEDMVRNLAPAKALGMTTVWINNGSEQAGGQAHSDYVDYEITDLTAWLDTVLGAYA